MAIKRNCEICNREFKVFPYVIKNGGGRFCSKFCSNVRRKGKTQSSVQRQKQSMGLKRYYKELSPLDRERRVISARIAWRNNPQNAELLKNLASKRKGDKHPNWRGGHKRSLMTAVRQTKEYKDFRNYVFQWDDYTCQKCGDRTRVGHRIKIQMHHIVSLREIVEGIGSSLLEEIIAHPSLWDMGNTVTLCEGCHRKTSNFGGRLTFSLYGKIAKHLNYPQGRVED